MGSKLSSHGSQMGANGKEKGSIWEVFGKLISARGCFDLLPRGLCRRSSHRAPVLRVSPPQAQGCGRLKDSEIRLFRPVANAGCAAVESVIISAEMRAQGTLCGTQGSRSSLGKCKQRKEL